MALPPKAYGSPKEHFHNGVSETDRFPAVYPSHDEEEYLENKSLSPSRHRSALSTSSGLMELHYDTMRKKQSFRSTQPTFVGPADHGPKLQGLRGLRRAHPWQDIWQHRGLPLEERQRAGAGDEWAVLQARGFGRGVHAGREVR
eukprot:CAMPEP_0204175066 /NCGR_PEP_ID=MMETSP0361-20130328/46428_1 /ASSEMBLY_ACC=CAM_ASM_000343 /TAXON_ID=268821 /ORGANISM="Scrippsiella Hangoei, Strain SHTV-5" /LENGTH=143 /DNA_ID=CAMNT_0051133653 /DNA_START=36 /DNA_END=467 /DNA_ORIENTATION=-